MWAILAGALLAPVSIIRVIAAFLLMTFFPGAVIWSFVDPDERNPFVFLVCGAAFLTVFVYFCAWSVWFFIPVAVSFLCVVFLEKKKVPFVIDRQTIYLLGCILFVLVYMYPWGDYVEFYPPGDEMKLHLLHTTAIVQERALPSAYYLYPEIDHVGQPLGFHGLITFVADASRSSIIFASTFVGMFIGSLGCISVYLLGKTLFSEEKGLAAAFSFVFLSFFFHQLGFSGSYIVLAGVTFQVLAVAAVVRASRLKTRTSFVAAGLLCAACFSTDLNAFFPLACFLILFFVVNRFAFSVLAAFFLFSLPQLARLSLPAPTSLELHFIEEWFHITLVSNPEKVVTVLFSVGPLLLIFALLQVTSIRLDKTLFEKKEIQYFVFYSVPFFIPLVLGSLLPFWYALDSLLIFRMISVPLSLLSALFLVRLRKIAQFKWFVSGLILFSAVILVTDPFVILPSLPPTVNADALAAYQWISENTPPESTLYNFVSHSDSSTWIPVSAQRRIFLPSHLYYQGDNVMTRLDLPERFTDTEILEKLPGSTFAKDILEKYRISHLYIDGESPVDVNLFLHSPVYHLEFHQGDTYIFSVTDAEPFTCESVRLLQGRDILYGYKSYFYFSNLEKGTLIGVHYADRGFGNVDVEVNGEYVGTIFRFDSGEHFTAFFVIDSSENISVSFLPYEEVFYIDYVVIYECVIG